MKNFVDHSHPMYGNGIELPEGVEAVQVIRSWRDRNSFKFLRPLNTVEL